MLRRTVGYLAQARAFVVIVAMISTQMTHWQILRISECAEFAKDVYGKQQANGKPTVSRSQKGRHMKKDRKVSVASTPAVSPILTKRQGRREFLIKTGGALAAGAFGAVPLRGWAADPINIGALYPTTGSMAQIGVGCVAAAKLAVETVNEAGGIK